MALSTSINLSAVLAGIQNAAVNGKNQGQLALATLQAGNVSTNWAFNFIDSMLQFIGNISAKAATPGLNAFATANIPGYAGTLTTDINAVVTAGQACISWIVNNFPKDSTNTFILAETLNIDGTRTMRQFTPAQTAGLQSALTTFIATIN